MEDKPKQRNKSEKRPKYVKKEPEYDSAGRKIRKTPMDKNMKEINKALWSDRPLEGVKKFNERLQNEEDKKAFVKHFLERSWCNEMLRPFGNKSVKFGQLKSIVESLTTVLNNLSLDIPRHKEVALKIAVHMVETKAERMREVLHDGRADRIKTGLNCLSAMASVGGEVACKVIEFLAEPHPCFDRIVNYNEFGVRSCYIQLLFEFLTSDDSYVLDQFLSKSDLLPSIFSGLKYGECEEVLVVLNSLHEHVLMNPNVNKKRKIFMFTPDTVRPLLNLRGWRGPSAKSSKSKEETNNTDNETKIRRTLFKFMLTLCSSHDHGIVIRSSGSRRGGSSSNSNILRILSEVKKPWETAEGVVLVSRVFAACPELLPNYLDSLKHLLFPRWSTPFISLMEMLVEIIKLQEPWQFMESSKWQSVVPCIFPGFPLNQNFYLRLCQNEHGTVRYVGCALMLAVLRKAKETLAELKNSGLPNDVCEKIKQKLIEEMSNTFGKQVLNTLIISWKYLIERSCNKNSEEREEECMVEEEEVKIKPTDEILAIVEFFNHYSYISSSLVVEVLCPVDVLKTVQYVSNMKSEELDLNNWTKNEFWTACLDLLFKSISQRKFSIGIESLEENIFHVIIKTNAHCLRSPEFTSYCSEENKDVQCNLADMLSVALNKAGIADDSENISLWLRHVSGPNYVKLSTFLTHIIQQTVRSYNLYTDSLIEIKEKFTNKSSVPCLVDVDPVILDKKQVSVILGYNKPFSRFVLAAADLLTANPDDENKQYISHVLSDYIHSMCNPSLLIHFLIGKSSLINDSLKSYLGCFVNHSKLPKIKSGEVIKDLSLTEVLKTSFMTQDFTAVSSILESDDIQSAVRGNIRLIVLQVLLYFFVEHEKSNKEIVPAGKTHVEILKKLYAKMVESDEKSAVVIVKTVLEHPRVLALYSPAEPDRVPISSLSQYFIEIVFQKHPDSIMYTYPYYLKTLSSLKSTSMLEETFIAFNRVLSPFVTSESTILSYDDVEELLEIYLKLPHHSSTSCGPILHKLLSLLWKVTTPIKRPQEGTVLLLFNKYLEWTASKKEESDEIHNDLLGVIESFLPQIMTTKVSQQITQGDLKRVLQCGSGSADICCQLVKLHHPHGDYLASRLKDNSENCSKQAKLISILMSCEESRKIALELLPKLRERLKEWALTLSEGSGYWEDLFLESLKADVFDSDDLVDICLRTYKHVNKKILPQRNLSYLTPIFEKISGNPVLMAKLPFKDSGICFLHTLLNVIKVGYKKDRNNSLMLSCCHLVEIVLQEIDNDLLKTSFAENKFWASLVKQILRNGLSDVNTGPKVIHSLALLIDVMYVNDYKVDVLESHNELTLSTVYQMIISHTQYLALMFQRELEWDKLKESVVDLQQTIVNCDRSICMENHIPVLLGAYEASMSAVDQKILRLLHTYEAAGEMNTYQPVLWGDAAVSHFGTHTSIDTFEQPKTNQILGLLKSDKMFKTCRSFDINLPLEPEDVCGDDKTIYDMRFLIPLMLYLSEDEKLLEIDFAESGAVAVGFTCLSSHQKEIWAAGATILKRVVAKMINSRHIRFKLPWHWAITIVVSSFDGKEHRLPSVILHFLLHTTRLLSSPQDPMYFIILKSVFIRPTLELLRVPQFSRLYTSEDAFDNRLHLLFLLNFLSTGIRYPEDYYICQKTSTATLMMSLLQSPTADFEIKEQTLRVLESIVSIPVGAHDLISKYNLLMMLPVTLKLTSFIKSVEEDSCISIGLSKVTSAIVRILAAVWSSMLTAKDTETSLTRRLNFNPTVKRKRDEEKEDSSSDVSSSLSSDEDDDDEGPVPKKLKTDTGSIDKTEKSMESTDVTKPVCENQESRGRRLHPLFAEEYLNCLLCIASDVIKHAPPECASNYIGLIIKALDHMLKSSSQEKETIRTVAQNPEILKEMVHSSLPWELLQKSLADCLTEDELVRVLGDKAEEHMQMCRKEPLSELLKKTQDTDCNMKSSNVLKKLTFDLLDLLGK
ncbi:nucleolar pre-ribosomal-associated protein 1 [Palaemon carinicauda]|uniref:nucleolar pre-ribosomal-associated protein 1 n=1 Tax=Palaemon carinicauda TaxID=392227 RepID=UPI0035B64071